MPAKRYLVATDSRYAAALTTVSAQTLEEQGGPMTAAEIAAFESHPDCRLAVRLREIDDQGKVPGATVPGLDAYRGVLTDVVAASRSASA